MKWLVRNLLALLLLPPGMAFAQSGLATDVRHGASLPATCQNQIFIKTGDGFYYCGSVANSWFAALQVSAGLTTGTVPLATGVHSVGDSPITYDGTTLSGIIQTDGSVAWASEASDASAHYTVQGDAFPGGAEAFLYAQRDTDAAIAEWSGVVDETEAEVYDKAVSPDGSVTAQTEYSAANDGGEIHSSLVGPSSTESVEITEGEIESSVTDGMDTSTLTQTPSGVSLSTLDASLPVCTNGSKQFVTAACGIALTSDLASYVLVTRTVNGHALSGDITVTASDLGLATVATSGSASDLGSGTLPAGRLPNPSSSSLGGVQSIATASHNFMTGISTSGVPSKAQPACADLSDAAASCATSALNASNISSGTLGLARGGTNVDLSASGSSTAILAQDASHVISARALIAADIPSLAASILTSGQVALARGGTNADLSASGSSTAVLAQDASHVISARALIAADIPSLAASILTSGQVALARGGTGVDLSASGSSTAVLAEDASHVISARALIAADIPSLAASILTSGQVGLARGGTNVDLSATGSATAFLAQDASHVVSARSIVAADIPAQTYFNTCGGVFCGTGAIAGSFTQNQIVVAPVYITYRVTASSIAYDVTTADNTSNSYDVGLFGPGCSAGASSIPLAAHSGTTAGTSFAPATGVQTLALTGAPITLSPGWYCLAWTSNAASPLVILGSGAGTGANVQYQPFATGAKLSGGGSSLPSTITAPNTANTKNGTADLELY